MTTTPSRFSMASGAALALQFLMTGTASGWAYPTIDAEAYCDHQDFSYYITYTSTSWCTDRLAGNGCGNPSIDILVDGELKDNGAYAYPSYSFSGGPFGPYIGPAGTTKTVQAIVRALWDDGYGGGQTAGTTVTFPEDPMCEQGTGRFTGGGHQLRVLDESGTQIRVTRGLTLHCDLVLSNNLEVNWQGNRFHMTEHLTTVQCSDDPDIDQFPPAAPLDTLIGIGTGRFNGEAGYTIEFTLVDAGEPGRSDQMRIYIFDTADPGNVVLDVPLQFLTGGNLQAHYDQPHK